MPDQTPEATSADTLDIDLRNPVVAAILAWLWPGAGHIYQRRYAKGVLFMTCILGTWFFGLTLGGGHVVYASWNKNDHRWQYICQLGVGAPAFPALAQAQLAKNKQEPWLGGFMAPPRNVKDDNATAWDLRDDELAQWHLDYHSYFELGTLYTMIAGLLNVLAIYDAGAGPMIVPVDEKKDKPPPGGGEKTS